MFQFRRFPTYAYLIQRRLTEYCSAGFPHSVIHGSTRMCRSPWLIAACHDLLRLLMPRHSPCALSSLTSSETFVSTWFSTVKELCRHSTKDSSASCCVYPFKFPQLAVSRSLWAHGRSRFPTLRLVSRALRLFRSPSLRSIGRYVPKLALPSVACFTFSGMFLHCSVFKVQRSDL